MIRPRDVDPSAHPEPEASTASKTPTTVSTYSGSVLGVPTASRTAPNRPAERWQRPHSAAMSSEDLEPARRTEQCPTSLYERTVGRETRELVPGLRIVGAYW